MMAFLRDRVDRFFGAGSASTSIPIMDGPLQPNDYIEAAPLLVSAEELDNLTAVDGGLHFTSRNSLFRLDEGGKAVEVAVYDAPISCLTAFGDALAVGLDGEGLVVRGGPHDGFTGKFICPAAALFVDSDTLIVATGSRKWPLARWKHDLMQDGQSGSLWRVDLARNKATQLVDSLAFPYGLVHGPDRSLVYTEAWRHRVMKIGPDGVPSQLLTGIPGYPGRIIPAGSGGYWLGVFAPRNQLVEFVLREPEYRDRMIAEVDPDLWVAPALASHRTFREPLQGGGVRQMGILKPWAPLRSFGLVVKLDDNFRATGSYHSRADGRRHGITSLAEYQGKLIAGSKGKGEAIALDITSETKDGSA